jgi:hypothetical protein
MALRSSRHNPLVLLEKVGRKEETAVRNRGIDDGETAVRNRGIDDAETR